MSQASEWAERYRAAVIDKTPITSDQTGCARCHGDGHPNLTYLPLTHPYEGSDGWIATHYAPCPANGEPILLGYMPEPDKPPTP